MQATDLTASPTGPSRAPPNDAGAHQAPETVEPRKRRRKRSPSDRRREARRLVGRIEDASGERQVARSDGRAVEAQRLTTDLSGPDLGPYSPGGLYADKRALRREIYAQRPALEGQPIKRVAPRLPSKAERGGGLAR
jgi:hypothetical protein